MKTFVVAGSYYQASEWIKKDRFKHNKLVTDYVYVSSVTDLRGYQNPHGVFIGTWRDRPDIRDVVEALIIQSVLPVPKLREIWGELIDKTKPIQPSQGILRGAEMLAQAIDAEVLATITKKINGGDLNG
jgi:hypothetical protein